MARASRTLCVSCPDQIPDAGGCSHAYFMVSSMALEDGGSKNMRLTDPEGYRV